MTRWKCSFCMESALLATLIIYSLLGVCQVVVIWWWPNRRFVVINPLFGGDQLVTWFLQNWINLNLKNLDFLVLQIRCRSAFITFYKSHVEFYESNHAKPAMFCYNVYVDDCTQQLEWFNILMLMCFCIVSACYVVKNFNVQVFVMHC